MPHKPALGKLYPETPEEIALLDEIDELPDYVPQWQLDALRVRAAGALSAERNRVVAQIRERAKFASGADRRLVDALLDGIGAER